MSSYGVNGSMTMSADTVSTASRAALGQQPAQHLLLDLGFPMSPSVIQTVITAVHSVLTLACCIRGGMRVPAFGLSVINNTFHKVFKLSPMQGNFVAVVNALNSVAQLAPVNERLSYKEFEDCLHLAILSITNEFSAEYESVHSVPMASRTSHPTQLQVTLVTKKSGSRAQQCLEGLLQSTTAMKLKKIQVVELCDPTLPSSSQDKACNNFPKSMGFVDVVQLPHEDARVVQFFKAWLLDCNTDHEHVSIVFPGRSSKDHLFTLKCDLNDTLVNPLALPFGHRFQLQTDFSSIQLGGSIISKVAARDLPIYELEVIGRLPSSGVCESLLFGQPQRLLPTQCWQLDWEQLTSNQQCFMAVCNNLTLRDEYLLTRLRPQACTDITGYFIIIFGDNNLLLKPVASAELVMPSPAQERMFACKDDHLSKAVITAVDSALQHLSLLDEYKPNEFPSGLYPALQRSLQQHSGNFQVTNSCTSLYCYPTMDTSMYTDKNVPEGQAKRGWHRSGSSSYISKD